MVEKGVSQEFSEWPVSKRIQSAQDITSGHARCFNFVQAASQRGPQSRMTSVMQNHGSRCNMLNLEPCCRCSRCTSGSAVLWETIAWRSNLQWITNRPMPGRQSKLQEEADFRILRLVQGNPKLSLVNSRDIGYQLGWGELLPVGFTEQLLGETTQ